MEASGLIFPLQWPLKPLNTTRDFRTPFVLLSKLQSVHPFKPVSSSLPATVVHLLYSLSYARSVSYAVSPQERRLWTLALSIPTTDKSRQRRIRDYKTSKLYGQCKLSDAFPHYQAFRWRIIKTLYINSSLDPNLFFDGCITVDDAERTLLRRPSTPSWFCMGYLYSALSGGMGIHLLPWASNYLRQDDRETTQTVCPDLTRFLIWHYVSRRHFYTGCVYTVHLKPWARICPHCLEARASTHVFHATKKGL